MKIWKLDLFFCRRSIDEEQPKFIPREFGWTAYHPLETIYKWLYDKLAEYPDLLTVYTIGRSHENREIRAVKLSHKLVSGHTNQ